LGQNFPEGTSLSDPSAIPRRDDPADHEDPQRRDGDPEISSLDRNPEDEEDAEDAPESQQAG
jgi:hypothetical protein